MSEDLGDGMWWLFTDVLSWASRSSSNTQPWPETQADRPNGSPVLQMRRLRLLVHALGLGPATGPTELSEGEGESLISTIGRLGHELRPWQLGNSESATLGRSFGRGGRWEIHDPEQQRKLNRDERAKRWVVHSDFQEFRVSNLNGERRAEFWLERLPWFRATWIGPLLSCTGDPGLLPPTYTDGSESVEVPDVVSEFLAETGPAADLDAALLVSMSWLCASEPLRLALRSACPSPSRWAAGRLLAERAVYGAEARVEYRWLSKDEAEIALRAATERVGAPWPSSRYEARMSLEKVPGVGLAEFDRSKLRPLRLRYNWEEQALVERAAHILGLAPDASAEEISARVAAVMPSPVSAAPLSEVGELMEAVASAERDRAQLAAAVLLANLHTKEK